jgi:hypothetical protein
MRKQRLIEGLNNSQKIRFIVDGVGMYCKISDVENFATVSSQQAVISALQNLQASRELAFAKCQPQPTGFGIRSVFSGKSHDVQVDLV